VIEFISLSVLMFCSTDIDDLFVLITFFADRRFRTRDVVAGQYIGMAVLFGISVSCSLTLFSIPKTEIGLLGLVPILVGGRKLYLLWREKRKVDELAQSYTTGAGILTVAALTMANGGDNIAVWTSLFATHSAFEIALAALVFTVMIGAWCLSAGWLARHPALAVHFQRYGHKVVPFVLIGLGLIILFEAGSVDLLRHGIR
jgi:cadmium resistance protein CadD (predicted permease)